MFSALSRHNTRMITPVLSAQYTSGFFYFGRTNNLHILDVDNFTSDVKHVDVGCLFSDYLRNIKIYFLDFELQHGIFNLCACIKVYLDGIPTIGFLDLVICDDVGLQRCQSCVQHLFETHCS